MIKNDKDSFAKIGGRRKPIITTKGWDIQVRWKDGSSDWFPMSLVKQSNPIELAEYLHANNLQNEPAFRWWTRKILKKRKSIINKIKTRMRKPRRMNFSVKVPLTAEEAIALDKQNGNTLWNEVIEKEIKNSRIDFEVLDKDTSFPVGHTEITCHLIFDDKMDLTRKARYVAGVHLTDTPPSMTYASVVGRETVRIAFLVAALNDLNIFSGNIQNAYLNAETKEKIFFYAGDEWRSNRGRILVIRRALYGLKFSALMWRNHLSDVIGNELGFKSYLSDPYIWMKAIITSSGYKYYAYI